MMVKHVTHYYVESGWPDDYYAGCHLEVYEKTSCRWNQVTCKFCLCNEEKRKAQVERWRAASQTQGEPKP